MVVFLHFHGFPAERFPEAEPHLENVMLVVGKVSFQICFGNLKGGVRETIFLEPIYL